MKKLAVVGAGSMAEAIIAGILESNLLKSSQIYVTNKCNQEKLEELSSNYHVKTGYDMQQIFTDADAIMLAMKPKDAADAIRAIKDHLTSDTLIISVLAGVSISSIEQLAGKELAVVRTMPNTSAAIGKSASALAINERVSEQQMQKCKKIFETIGFTAIVEEEQLDAVTGLSGSGPAYVYYLAEAMVKSAKEIGLDNEMAKGLIIQTLIGAAEMLAKSHKTPAELRKAVTSPGGTTEAGIQVLEANEVQQSVIDCIKTAAERSKQLGENFSSKVKV
ncbi:pyrroline-5-carboxylate reductase [Cytobacillus gottheilii]|uniref:pyrroline-5-carboxylate reductase n=1 Tax=Cytobacillus gottheilii TaxID=859144 RepID=UPI003CE96511